MKVGRRKDTPMNHLCMGQRNICPFPVNVINPIILNPKFICSNNAPELNGVPSVQPGGYAGSVASEQRVIRWSAMFIAARLGRKCELAVG